MKNQTNRTSLLVLSFLALLYSSTQAQYFWTEPQAITDSLADNRNATVVELPLGHYIFWEKTIDETSTAIYCRNLYTADEPMAIHEAPGIHYRNPRFIQTSGVDDDTLCYFFYESDAGGNFDIYYHIFKLDGFTEPMILANSTQNETHFRCNGGGSMVWQEGDKIKYARLDKNWNHPFKLSDPVTIDSNDCFSPDVPFASFYNSPSYTAWLKGDVEDASIWYSLYDWQSSTWLPPELFSDEGNNISLRFAMDPCYGATTSGEVLVWENIIGGMHTIRLHHMWDGEYMSEFQQASPFLPMYGNYMIPSESDIFYGFMTVVDAETQNGDILVNDEGWEVPTMIEGFVNLSDSPFEETNPEFYNGFCHDYWCDLVLTWESRRNDHWQIFYSTNELMCAGGTDENQVEKIEMQVYPNPARDECMINYSLPEESFVSLMVTTLDGRQVSLIDHEFLPKGEYDYHLNLDRVFHGSSVCGMFMVSLQTSGGNVTRKMLRVE